MNKAASKLQELTKKKHVFFTDRGNSSIKLALKLAKSKGLKKLILQNQGGWITYSQFGKELKFELVIVETDHGLLQKDILKKHIDETSVLLTNSMPGYFCLQEDMEEIFELCKKKGCFVINDASASIGRVAAKYGDLVLGSFGEWKPIEVKYGGFISFDEKNYQDFFEEHFKRERKDFFSELNKEIDQLPKRLKIIDEECEKIKKQMKDFDILHRESKGLNVIIRFQNDIEKLKILDYCKLYGYEFTLCPRYIRVLENAISIEVKRKQSF